MHNIKPAVLAILARNINCICDIKDSDRNPPTLLGSGDGMKGLHFDTWIIQKEELQIKILASNSATWILQDKQKCKSTGNFHKLSICPDCTLLGFTRQSTPNIEGLSSCHTTEQ